MCPGPVTNSFLAVFWTWAFCAILKLWRTALQIIKRPDCKTLDKKDLTVNDSKRTKRKKEKK
jgi:hypothetical protein